MVTIECFEDIFLSHNRDVLYYLLGLASCDYVLAEEVMQETFFQAYRSIHKFRGDSSVKTWLFAIAKNTLAAHYRKTGKSIPLEQMHDQHTDETHGFEDIIEHGEMLEKAILVIANMPPKLSDVLTMRVIEGLPYSKIAYKLSVQENSARVLFTRAKAELRKQLKETYGYDIEV